MSLSSGPEEEAGGTSHPDLAPGLYVVGTPIGNLEDLSPRARRILAAAAIVAAEDTRTANALLPSSGTRPRTVSLTEHNVSQRAPGLLAAAAESPVALVSEAGTPAIADPGARLVERAHAQGVPVFAVPGPSALTAAVSASGFDGSDVYFLGFLPRQAGARATRLKEATSAAKTVVFLESPGRLVATLRELASDFGDPEVAVCRELTKLHEQNIRGKASDLAQDFGDRVRGECTVVIGTEKPPADTSAARTWMAAMHAAGARRSGAAAAVGREIGVSRAVAYELWPAADEGPGDDAVIPSGEPSG